MIRVGFVGTGGFTRHHISFLQEFENVRVVGFVGSSEEKAANFANKYKNTTGYASLESMVKHEQLDAVYICVPPMGHENYEEFLIEAGIPFLVEKPLGVDGQQVRRVRDKVRESNHLTSVGYHFRYMETIKQFQEKLHYMKAGTVLGKWMGSMPDVYWWKNQAQSGGQFNEQTTHIVDLIRFLFGEVKSVYAQEANTITKGRDATVTVADVGLFSLTMKNDVIIQITNTAVLPDGIGEVGIKAYTDRGIIDWQPEYIAIKTNDKMEKYWNKQNPYRKESEAFLHAVATGDRSKILSAYEDSWHTFTVALAARKSIQENRVVNLDELDA